ncbi:hypothetical protein [Rickettsia australis]|uniref:hypothetical protein n=1 Tax=Rickettsia australis TaxID=787 RepID=UPI0003154084|nr:hypothetical protein [Rickettsia australis]
MEQKNIPNLTILEECNILMKLRNINIKEILTPNTSFISKYEYKDIIALGFLITLGLYLMKY